MYLSNGGQRVYRKQKIGCNQLHRSYVKKDKHVAPPELSQASVTICYKHATPPELCKEMVLYG